MIVSYFKENTSGRDFVVGDIHGSFDMVRRAMSVIEFDGANDRLFCVGDLVDRGNFSRDVLKFMSMPGVHSIIGNHEHMLLDLYEGCDFTEQHPPLNDKSLSLFTRPAKGSPISNNGMDWWIDESPELREQIIRAFRQLPAVIEIQSARGTVGLVHAEVPIGMDWSTFKARIMRDDEDTVLSALWGRERLQPKRINGVMPPQYDGGVAGVGRIFSGHTILDCPAKLGNVYFLDTGAVFRDLSVTAPPPDARKEVLVGHEWAKKCRLTVVNMVMKTEVLVHAVPPDEDIDARTMSEVPLTPFGAYIN